MPAPPREVWPARRRYGRHSGDAAEVFAEWVEAVSIKLAAKPAMTTVTHWRIVGRIPIPNDLPTRQPKNEDRALQTTRTTMHPLLHLETLALVWQFRATSARGSSATPGFVLNTTDADRGNVQAGLPAVNSLQIIHLPNLAASTPDEKVSAPAPLVKNIRTFELSGSSENPLQRKRDSAAQPNQKREFIN